MPEEIIKPFRTIEAADRQRVFQKWRDKPLARDPGRVRSAGC